MFGVSKPKLFRFWLDEEQDSLLATFDSLASQECLEMGARVVFECCIEYPEQRPHLYGRKFRQLSDAIRNWLDEYTKGYNSRPSVVLAKPIGTVPDRIIDEILSVRLKNLTQDDLKEICDAHRLSMSAENLLGNLLEEYLAMNFAGSGWYCAWGKTIKSVDFCSEDHDLLQVKNRSNSENSSSDKVREGTGILKWHRINAGTGTTYWEDLSSLTGCNSISESGFKSFVVRTVSANPGSLYVEPGNTWID